MDTPETLIDVIDAAPAAKDGDFHHAPHPLTVQVIEGCLKFTVEDRDHHLKPGRVLHVPEGVVHSVHADHRDAVFLLMLST